MSGTIHPTAIIEDGATLGEGVKIGPYCVVGAEAKLGDEVELVSQVVVAGRTTIGARCKVYPFASVGHRPQDLKYAGEPSTLEIGENTTIREHVTINPGTAGGGMITKIGNNCWIMIGVHIGHDCMIFSSEGTLRERVEDAAAIFPKDQLVQDVVKFIIDAKDMPLTLPRNGHSDL